MQPLMHRHPLKKTSDVSSCIFQVLILVQMSLHFGPLEPASEIRHVQLLGERKKPNEETKDVTSCCPTTVRGTREKGNPLPYEPILFTSSQVAPHLGSLSRPVWRRGCRNIGYPSRAQYERRNMRMRPGCAFARQSSRRRSVQQREMGIRRF